jgi:hypothetical protein
MINIINLGFTGGEYVHSTGLNKRINPKVARPAEAAGQLYGTSPIEAGLEAPCEFVKTALGVIPEEGSI